MENIYRPSSPVGMDQRGSAAIDLLLTVKRSADEEASKGIHSGSETQRRRHQKSKTGVSVKWQIQGGRPPYRLNFLIFMQFFGKSGKFVCWRPSWRVCAPSYEESWIRPCSGPTKGLIYYKYYFFQKKIYRPPSAAIFFLTYFYRIRHWDIMQLCKQEIGDEAAIQH